MFIRHSGGSGPLNISAIRDAHHTFLNALNREADLAASAAEDAIKADLRGGHAFKHPTGKLAAKTKFKFVRTRRGNLIRISNDSPYALAQERGSGTHRRGGSKYIIRAKNGKAL